MTAADRPSDEQCDAFAAELAKSMESVDEVVCRAGAARLTIGDTLDTRALPLGGNPCFTHGRPDDLVLPRCASVAIDETATAPGRDRDELLAEAAPALVDRIRRMGSGMAEPLSAPAAPEAAFGTDGTKHTITPLEDAELNVALAMPLDSLMRKAVADGARAAGVAPDACLANPVAGAVASANQALTIPAEAHGPIREVAAVLGVPAQLFLDWKLAEMAEELAHPYGELEEWALGGLMEWDSPAEADAVRQRFAEWLKSKGLPPEQIARRMRGPLTGEQIDRLAQRAA